MSDGDLKLYQMPFSSKPFWRMGRTLLEIGADGPGLLALQAWAKGCREFQLHQVRKIVEAFLALADVQVRLVRAEADAKERRATFAAARARQAADAGRRKRWEAQRGEEMAAHNLERGI